MPVQKVAEKNILVYKQLSRGNYSLHTNYKYKKGRVNPSITIESESGNYWEDGYWEDGYVINKGYHSRNSASTESKSHLFIIPKGATYVEGGENEIRKQPDGYVSSTIIFVGRNNFINKFIAKLKYEL